MKKPMLGIIAVCLLQVAFVAYNAVELPFDRTAVSPIREMMQIPAEVATEIDDIVVVRSGQLASEKLPVEKTTNKVPALLKTAPKGYSRPEPVRPRAVVAGQKRPVRTEFPVAPLEFSDSNDALSASVVAKENKKKSFFSKALPVLKKPYSWAKAFAGKFN